MIIFLFLHKNICCGYSLEAPLRGASNEYPQHMFLWNKKNIYLIPSYLGLQMSLSIHRFWSLCTFCIAKVAKFLHADNKADQTAMMRRPICVSVGSEGTFSHNAVHIFRGNIGKRSCVKWKKFWVHFNTIITLSIGTDRPLQTVYTEIRCIWSGSRLFAIYTAIIWTHQDFVYRAISNFRTSMVSR